MTSRRVGFAGVVLLFACAACLFQFPGGCATWAAESALTSVDLCFILNCDGLFGGSIRLCNDPSIPGGEFLADCGGGTTTTQDTTTGGLGGGGGGGLFGGG